MKKATNYLVLIGLFIIYIGNQSDLFAVNRIETGYLSLDVLTDSNKISYKIFPIDESKSDTSLVSFIENLKIIVTKKDTFGLFSLLDTDVIVSYGGGLNGVKDFKTVWQLDQPEKSALWDYLQQILYLGGTWEEDDNDSLLSFCIPYAHSDKAFSKINYEFNWFITAVCVSSKANVYKEPKLTSTVLSNLSYDIVEVDKNYKDSVFSKIWTLDNKVKGFVKTKYLIFSASPKLVIKKNNNNWKICSFAPYD